MREAAASGEGKSLRGRHYQRRAHRTDRGHRVIQRWRRCCPAPCRACQPKLRGIVNDMQSTHASSTARVHTWMHGTDTETWPPSTPMSPMKLSSVVRCACGGSRVRGRGPAAKSTCERGWPRRRSVAHLQPAPTQPVCQTAPPRAARRARLNPTGPPHGGFSP